MNRILIIDDDRALCRSLEIQLTQEGHRVESAHSGGDGLRKIADFDPGLVLLDVHLPDMDGLDLLQKIQQARSQLPVVIITGRQEMKVAIEAMRRGAFDYLRKPFDLDEIFILLEKAARLEKTSRTVESASVTLSEEPAEIVGSSRPVIELMKQIGLLARSRVTVLIEGESGTGKELVARALHEASSAGKPFVAINCSAVVPTLLESELFGHEKGAFTGADNRKTGRLEHAGEGTVFLDEIGDMPLALQAKILRVLQERSFERVGGLEQIDCRARIIAATNRDLDKLVAEGAFREDLFYRLAVSRLRVPALRERREDIPTLALHLLARIGHKIHRPLAGIDPLVMKQFEIYDWPGNVRELENVLTRAAALARGSVITAVELGLRPSSDAKAGPAPKQIRPLRDVENEYIRLSLEATGWNITKTARLLEISPTTLRKKIEDYSLHRQ